MYNLGLSISYDRVLALSTEMGNSVSDRFEEEQTVCPPNLGLGIFTTAAVDNIDHNPSSNTAQGSFHGTGISIFQHPSAENTGVDREVVIIDSKKPRQLRQRPLPDSYIRVPPAVVRSTIQFLNPGQTPIIAFDQPLFAVAKQIQWTWPDTHGEDTIVVMFGGLHIEMAALKTIGDWLEDSGWTHAIVKADIATPGTADSFIKAVHVSRTRHSHQVTACALNILLHQAYAEYQHSSSEVVPLDFEMWKEKRQRESPQFQYWCITLEFELTILIFVRSLREGNFGLYKDALTKIVPWFFALDHPNYARWLPVHIRDMLNLPVKHHIVNTEFENGNFVLRKTHHAFSRIALDQAHEQNNKHIKGDGGAIGLTENATQLLRWMISGPEVSRVINEFELTQEFDKREQDKGTDSKHHEQVKCTQAKFRQQVSKLCEVIDEMGNPFTEQSDDLVVLDTRDIADTGVAETVRKIANGVGQEQYEMFVKERLEKRNQNISKPIKQNKFPLFSCQMPKVKSKEKQQITSLKQNCSLFAKLYISCQVRNGDLDEFFRHENQQYPPSISQYGKLRSGTKSDIMTCLERLTPSEINPPSVEAVLLDGAAVVNMLKPGAARTFLEYAHDVFWPYVKSHLQQPVTRVDVVWDQYFADSLKCMTRLNRGKGVRRQVQPKTTIPSCWASFLKHDDNKSELFVFLANTVVELELYPNQQVITTKGNTVLCSPRRADVSLLSPCGQEEADTRLFLHVADADKQGYERVMIRTVDTDIVVLAISLMPQFQLKELWIAFGTGKNFRFLPIHKMFTTLGPSRSRALTAFHAFTGCDQTSAFAGRGKKTAWETWLVCDAVTPVFEALGNPCLVQDVHHLLPILERFVVLMYDRCSTCMFVNDARKDLFTHKGRSIEQIPPTANALLYHTQRAVFQAGYIWSQALRTTPELPSPSDWGWCRDSNDHWEPTWTTIPQASEICRELLRCGCNAEIGCRARCKCVKAELQCTALCKCGGSCDRN